MERIRKVLIPYILWTLLYSVLSHVKSFSDIPAAFIYNLVTAKAAAMMYYVPVYNQLTLLIPFVDKLARSRVWLVGLIISPLIFGFTADKYLSTIMSVSCLGWFIYFYLGYLLGNSLFLIRISNKALFLFWAFSICLQIAEGYWYYTMGNINCGTQLKLTAVLSGMLFVILAFRYITSEQVFRSKIIECVGNISFGIYFSHIAIMRMIKLLPVMDLMRFPINAIIVVIVSSACVIAGNKLFGRYGKYLAL